MLLASFRPPLIPILKMWKLRISQETFVVCAVAHKPGWDGRGVLLEEDGKEYGGNLWFVPAKLMQCVRGPSGLWNKFLELSWSRNLDYSAPNAIEP